MALEAKFTNLYLMAVSKNGALDGASDSRLAGFCPRSGTDCFDLLHFVRNEKVRMSLQTK